MSKRGKKKKPGKPSPGKIQEVILDFFEKNPGKSFNYKQVVSKLNIRSSQDQKKILSILEKMNEKGTLEEEKPGKYFYEFTSSFVEGVVDLTRKGHGYIIIDDKSEDVYVPARKLKTAMSGDRVKVLLYAKRKGKRVEGEVVEILERKNTQFVGTIRLSRNYGFLVPDNARQINTDIFIPPENLGEAKDGYKALVEITEWEEGASNPAGKVIEMLGKPGEHKTEMNAIIKSFGLPVHFPPEVLKEAEALPDSIGKDEINSRRDMRKVPTFTIDPTDAKDFDDALSMRKGEKAGTWEVGIHIADVTHYVKPGTELDKEGFRRATSIYLVDRVIPMLPERLSNELCSLRPDEDKLAFSAIFTIDSDGNVLHRWFGKTVIRSQQRFAYEDAQKVIETGEGPFSNEIKTLNQIAHQLRKKKFLEGAISFETTEVKFELDENGKPLRVIPLVRQDAHKLIEDFMLLANKEVAKLIFEKGGHIMKNPFVYRVHDAPAQDKLARFAKIAAQFGYKIDQRDNKTLARSFNKMLEEVEGKPEQNMIQSLAIRTMAKAFYTTKKSDHYGLAFDYYSHFTSPIRRYPDVITHRLLEAYLKDQQPMQAGEIEAQCKHCSEMEVKAEEAERASVKYKQVEYLQAYLGEEFDGLISGVTEWGFFVSLNENKCEGLVPMDHLIDDYYFFDEERYCLTGTNTGRTYRLGDSVRVRILETNLIKRTVTMDVA